MLDAVFAIPGDLSLPTGGYGYDRRVLALLGRHGIRAAHLQLPGTFPDPSADDLALTGRLFAAAPQGAVLLVDGLALGVIPPELIRRADRPLVALVHHPLCLEAGLTPERARTLAASEIAVLAEARAVIATSPTTRQILVDDFGVPASRITVAEPGTDPAARAPPTDASLLLAVGSIVPRKGYDVLVAALGGLPDRLPWRLTIAGAERDAATSSSLRWSIAGAGLSERITFAGAVSCSRLDELYGSAGIFVMPSLFEGYGMVLGEAMARGLPIVCTTGGAAAETVPDAAALKVAPGDAVALRAAISRLMLDEQLRRRMSDASWAAGQRLPRWDDTARLVAGALKGAVQ